MNRPISPHCHHEIDSLLGCSAGDAFRIAGAFGMHEEGSWKALFKGATGVQCSAAARRWIDYDPLLHGPHSSIAERFIQPVLPQIAQEAEGVGRGRSS